MGPRARWLDQAGALLISLLVIQAGWANTRASLLELADVGVDEDVCAAVRGAAEAVLAAADGRPDVVPEVR